MTAVEKAVADAADGGFTPLPPPERRTAYDIHHDPRRAEEELLDAIAATYDDARAFVMLAFEWGEGELAAFDGPEEWQCKFLDRVSLQVREHGFNGRDAVDPIREAVASGHGIGKSALVAWVILWIMSTRPYCKGTVTASTVTQLETKTWPELAKWHKRAINRHWFAWQGSKNNLRFKCILKDAKGDSVEDGWYTSGQTCKEENSESFAGQHAVDSTSFYIFDEASAVPDKIWEVAEGGMTDGEPMWFNFGNPTRNDGRFRDCFDKHRRRWNCQQIDSREVRITNKRQIAEWIEDYGEDSDFVRVRVKGQFPRASEYQYIAGDTVDHAFARELMRDPGAARVGGVDIARFGEDDTVFHFRQGLDGRTMPKIRMHGADTMEIADKCAEMLHRYKLDALFIEDVGIGAGVVDRLRQLGYGFRVIAVNPGSKASDTNKWASKREEMWSKGKDWLDRGCLAADPELRADLIAPMYEFGSNNKIVLESKKATKKRINRSTDHADALMLTFAAEVERRDMGGRGGRQEYAESDYDVTGGLPGSYED